ADLRDEAIVLSRFYDVIVVRALKNETPRIMAENSEAPIINGMCDRMHPCQGLADFMTISEFFGDNLAGLNLTYIGDGNNVCRSLIHGAANMDAKITICSPPNYTLDKETLLSGDGIVKCVDSPADAVRDADVIYTDTWISMGDESQTEERLAAFQNYQINADLMALAPKHALFMHCLPAHPNQEVTPDILRGPRSIVFDQAENRKHAQKALLEKFVSINVMHQRKNSK
ncbi:MAG: ornithine carbamoyltransferase, partial [Alphaproteobacteria bacterium]|nr:ornithine carbamoyltransferase [Alphaproteobacteria bacterium]